MLFYPTAIGWQFDEGDDEDTAHCDARETVQPGHAIANGLRGSRQPPAAWVGGEIRFWGRSFVADPSRCLFARAASDAAETLLVECDLAAIEGVRREWPCSRARRVAACAENRRRLRD